MVNEQIQVDLIRTFNIESDALVWMKAIPIMNHIYN